MPITAFCNKVFRFVDRVFGQCFATADGGETKLFDLLKEFNTSLLAQNLAEQHAEGTDVAAKGGFLQVSRALFEFRKALGPAFGLPERWHLV